MVKAGVLVEVGVPRTARGSGPGRNVHRTAYRSDHHTAHHTYHNSPCGLDHTDRTCYRPAFDCCGPTSAWYRAYLTAAGQIRHPQGLFFWEAAAWEGGHPVRGCLFLWNYSFDDHHCLEVH